MVEDFSTYKSRVNKKEHLDPRDDGLSKNELRHLKVLDLLDQDSVKSLNSLKDDLKLTSLHYLSHFRLERVILRLKTIYPDLKLSSNGVKTRVDKQGKSPLNNIPNVVEAFKRIKKGSNYYRRILVQQKPYGKTTYKGNMV